MSIWEFIWNAVWREAGKVTRVIQAISVTIPFVITISVGLAGGEWSKDLWPVWVWALITFGAMIAALFWGIASRAYVLEKANIPKLKIVWGNSRIFFEPVGGEDETTVCVRVGVRNLSSVVVEGVELVLANIISSDGAETYDINRLLSSHNISTRIALNPRDMKYYSIGLFGMSQHDGKYMEINGYKMCLTKQKTYRLKLRVSGVTSPSGHTDFLVGLDEKGGYSFQPAQRAQ